MSVFHENMLIGSSGQGAPAAAGISRSLRFNSSDSAFCSRVFSSAGNRTTWTWSGWVKRCNLAAQQTIFDGFVDGGNRTQLMFESDNTFRVLNQVSSSVTTNLITTPVYRDASAWYHVLVAWDTSQGTSSNRVKIYFNGSQVTAFATSTYPGPSENSFIDGANTHSIGRTGAFAEAYLSAYLADIHFISGQALTPSSFTEVSATTGQLIPKAYTGTYGTNGFKLTFSDNSNTTATTLGKDTSSNGNNWTPNNFSVLSGGPFSVAAASGALPIYNTTDTYGAVKGTGTRTDSNSGSIILAVPMDGTNGGTTFTDESATIKGSGSAKTITVNSATTSTAQSKYYGSSGSFDGSSSSLSIASSSSFAFTGDFTWEAWIYPTTNSVGAHSRVFEFSDTLWALYIYPASNNYAVYAQIGNQNVSANNVYKENQWTHLAIVKSGSTAYLYSNGTLLASAANSQTVAGPLSLTVNGNSGGSYRWPGYIQDLRMYTSAKYTSNFNPPSPTQNTTVAPGCDSLVDTPTSYGTGNSGGDVRGNFATLNPLIAVDNRTLSNGNLDVAIGGSNTFRCATSTIAVSSGKYYCELSNFAGTDANFGQLGLVAGDLSSQELNQDRIQDKSNVQSKGYILFEPAVNNYRIDSGSGVSYTIGGFTTGDVLGFAWDMDNKTCELYKNGSALGSVNFSSSALANKAVYFAINDRSRTNGLVSVNFGQRPFAYTAPSGFKALCDTNLPAPVVAKPNTVMDVKLYTGNGSTQTISGLGFGPDLVWVKSRNNASWWHVLTDAVRGGGYFLHSNNTNAEGGGGTSLITGFTSDGFSLNNSPNGTVNALNDTYVAWTWDAGSSTVTNTQGSITSQVRANASAGFSIVSFSSGSAGNYTVGHGLGAKPHFIITKARNGSTFNWSINHISIATTVNKYLAFTTNATLDNGAAVWGANLSDTNSTTFGISSANAVEANKDCIAYCFAPVAGYSSFGSYTGNGSADGPFVYTGFRPRWVMVKASSSVSYGSWRIYDSARGSYNVIQQELYANLSNSEDASNTIVDFLSNGFKLRSGAIDGYNGSGATIIYAAFAESPFQFSRAR